MATDRNGKPLSIQDMFDLAVRGLQSQEFKSCRTVNAYGGTCTYSDDLGCHCAWGWVDLDLGPKQGGGVNFLRNNGIGIARSLSDDELKFARALQGAHDVAGIDSYTKGRMTNGLLSVAADYGLEIPGDVDLGLGLGVGL